MLHLRNIHLLFALTWKRRVEKKESLSFANISCDPRHRFDKSMNCQRGFDSKQHGPVDWSHGVFGKGIKPKV
jgi:hypothetical protein